MPASCAVKDCERPAFVYVDDKGNIPLCAGHWRTLWSRGGFYDSGGWVGTPLELKDGRRVNIEAGRYQAYIEEPPYSGLQIEPVKE